MAARVAVALVALVVLAFLGVMEYDRRQLAHGVELLAHTGDPAKAAEARRALRRSELLNPDVEPETRLAQLAFQTGRPGEARRLLFRATRREPADVTAWVGLLILSRSRPAEVARIRAQLRRLDPLGRGGAR